MAWRQVQNEDIKLGTVIRLGSIESDGGYCMATIIGLHLDYKYPHIMVARPYAYASEYNSKQPLLGAEVFAIGISRLLEETSDIEVFEGRDEVRRMIT